MKHTLISLLLAVGVYAADAAPASLLSCKLAAIAGEAPATGAPAAALAPKEVSAEATEIARLDELPPVPLPVQGDTLANAITTIATTAGMNFIAPSQEEFPESITFNVTMNPWRFLNMLSDRYRFTMKFEDSVWVFNREAVGAIVAKTYFLRHATLDVYKASQNSFSSVGQVTNMSSGTTSEPVEGGMVFSAQSQKIIDDIRELIGLPPTEIAGENGKLPDNADSKRPVQGKAAELGGGRGGARVLYVADRKALYVACTRDQHKLVADYIKLVDVQPVQIRIEARFFETTWEPQTVFGIDPTNFQPNISLSNVQSQVNLASFHTSSEPATLSMGTVSLQINALASDKQTKLVQSPSVTTSDNREVYFSVGDEEPFVSSNNIYPGLPAGGFGASTANVSIRRIGTTINIVPTVFEGDNGQPASIRLIVRIEVGALKGFRQINQINIPVVSSQKWEYQRYVRNDQVLAFGGLAGIEDDDSIQKVPLLGDMPGVGYIFKSKSKAVHQRNLVAYIVARVISDDESAQMPALEMKNPAKAAAKGRKIFPQ